MSVPYGDIARLMHTAAQLEALEFYDFTFEHKLPPKLNLRAYGTDGVKLETLSQQDCAKLAEDLNAAIKPVLAAYARTETNKARKLLHGAS